MNRRDERYVSQPLGCTLPSYHPGKCNGTPRRDVCLVTMTKCPFCFGTSDKPGFVCYERLQAGCASSWHREYGSATLTTGESIANLKEI